jgi:hypothetical protein
VTDYNGFGTASPPGNPGASPATLSWQNDSGAYTFGQTFTVDTTGLSATKVRWYVPSGSPSAPTTGYYVALYEVGNSTPIASAGPVNATVGAWNEQAITPVALTSGAEYRSAVLFPGGYYGAQSPNAMPYDPAGPISFPSTGRFRVRRHADLSESGIGQQSLVRDRRHGLGCRPSRPGRYRQRRRAGWHGSWYRRHHLCRHGGASEPCRRCLRRGRHHLRRDRRSGGSGRRGLRHRCSAVRWHGQCCRASRCRFGRGHRPGCILKRLRGRDSPGCAVVHRVRTD